MGKVSLEPDCVLDPETHRLASCHATFDMDAYMESRQFTFCLMLLVVVGVILVGLVRHFQRRRLTA